MNKNTRNRFLAKVIRTIELQKSFDITQCTPKSGLHAPASSYRNVHSVQSIQKLCSITISEPAMQIHNQSRRCTLPWLPRQLFICLVCSELPLLFCFRYVFVRRFLLVAIELWLSDRGWKLYLAGYLRGSDLGYEHERIGFFSNIIQCSCRNRRINDHDSV